AGNDGSAPVADAAPRSTPAIHTCAACGIGITEPYGRTDENASHDSSPRTGDHDGIVSARFVPLAFASTIDGPPVAATSSSSADIAACDDVVACTYARNLPSGDHLGKYALFIPVVATRTCGAPSLPFANGTSAMLAPVTSLSFGIIAVSATATELPSGDQSGCVANFIGDGSATGPSALPVCASYSVSAPSCAASNNAPSGEYVVQPVGNFVAGSTIVCKPGSETAA